jgi:hypothetical protein
MPAPDKGDAAGEIRRVAALVREKIVPTDLLQIHGYFPLSAHCLAARGAQSCRNWQQHSRKELDKDEQRRYLQVILPGI